MQCYGRCDGLPTRAVDDAPLEPGSRGRDEFQRGQVAPELIAPLFGDSSQRDATGRPPRHHTAGVPSTNSLLAFSALAFAIIIIPGPSVMFVVTRALTYGRRAALLTVAGNTAGFYVQALLVAVGVGAVLERSVLAYNTVRFIGALYLVWLGVQTFRRRHELAGVHDATELQPRRSILLDGFVVGLANPKTVVFFAAVLPQYVRPGGAPAALQMALLGLVFAVVALASDSVWGLAAGTARGWFARAPRRLAQLGGAGGLAIAGLGLRLAVSRRD
jgi:threonine/homoserine/homoserine lactone efflux protein